MANLKDYHGGKKRIFNIGHPGGGKTCLFGTIPGKKFIYVFDPNALETLKSFDDQDIEYEAFFPEALNIDAVPLSAKAAERSQVLHPKKPTTYIDWEQDFDERFEDGYFDQFDCVALDSSSTFEMSIMDQIMFLNSRFGKWPEQADWTGTMNTMVNVYRTLTILPCHVYITAHLDEQTGRLHNAPSLIGKLKNRLPLLFTDLWTSFGDVDKDGAPRFFIQTAQDRENPYLRNSMGLDFEVDVTIEDRDFAHATEYGIGKIFKEHNVPLPTAKKAAPKRRKK